VNHMTTAEEGNKAEEFEKPLKILSPPLKATLGTAAGLTLLGLGWSVLAKIPIQTRGTAVFVPATSVRAVYAETSGVLFLYDPRELQDKWIKNAKKLFDGKVNEVSTEEIIEIAKVLAEDVPDKSLLLNPAVVNNANQDWRMEKGYLIARIRNSGVHSRLKKDLKDYLSATSSNGLKKKQLERQYAIYSEQLSGEAKYLKGMKELEKKNYVSQSTILQQESKISGLESDKSTVQGKILETEQDTEQKLNALYSSVIESISKGMYFSERSGYLNAVVSQTFNYVSEAEQLAITSTSRLAKPDEIPIVFSNKDAASVEDGMKVFLELITADSGAVSSRLVGHISSMNTFPSDKNKIQNMIGSKGIAELIESQYTAPTLGTVKLDRAKGGEYKLTIPTSSKRFENIRTQDTFSAMVTTSYVRPIELVLPMIKTVLGLKQLPPKPENLGAKS